MTGSQHQYGALRALVRLGESSLGMRLLLKSTSSELRIAQQRLRPCAGEAVDGAAYTTFLCQATFKAVTTMAQHCATLFAQVNPKP